VPKVRDILDAHGDTQMCRRSQLLLEFVGQRWMMVVLIAGHQGARRFTEYRRFAGGISDRVLSHRLRQLEQHQFIERTVIPTVPVQISYTPTQRGLSLVRAVLPLAAWALDETPRPPEVAASANHPAERPG
jgi:DNA-binding HxlR family transcriptional regulator